MSALHFGIDVALGAAFGFLGGVFGIGGGIVAIPILGLLFGMSEQTAQGTALVMVVPNVLLGLRRYYQKGSLNVRYGVVLALSAAPLTYAGARFATGVPSAALRVAFAVFTIAIAAFALVRTFVRARPRTGSAPWYAVSVLGAVAGAVSGVFGVGGSVFAVPIMAMSFGITQAAAQALGLALVALASSNTFRPSSRAGCASAPRLRGCWSTNPRRCCSMNRSARSTRSSRS